MLQVLVVQMCGLGESPTLSGVLPNSAMDDSTAVRMLAPVDDRRLKAIKLLHTLVWAGFAGCIVAIPVLTLQDRFRLAGLLALIVLGEVIVLAINRWRCPLTPIAARYTGDRRANFDIYLPEWLERYNQVIFGPLYLAGVVPLVVRWVGGTA